MAFKDASKRKVEEKENGRLVANSTKCFKSQGVGHYAKHYPTKRPLIFREDLNGWFENNVENCNKDIHEEEDEYDGEVRGVTSFNAGEDGMSFVTIRAWTT